MTSDTQLISLSTRASNEGLQSNDFSITEKHIRAFSWLKAPTKDFTFFSPNSVLNVKALVGTFNQEKALVGAFSVIVCEIFANLGIAFVSSSTATAVHRAPLSPLIGYVLNALCAVINDPDDRRSDKAKYILLLAILHQLHILSFGL